MGDTNINKQRIDYYFSPIPGYKDKVISSQFYNTNREWFDFLEKYQDYFKGISYQGYTRIARELFSDIDNLMAETLLFESKENEIRLYHKPLIFSLYVLLSNISRDKKKLSISELKEMLGYSSKTKTLDYIFKENGILDIYSFTKTGTKGIKGKGRKSIKYKYLDKDFGEYAFEGNFLILQTTVLMYMLFHIRQICVEGVYLYCYLLSKLIMENEQYKRTPLSTEKIVNETGIKDDSVAKYLLILQEYGLIEIYNGERIINEYGEFIRKEVNQYMIYTELNDRCIFSREDDN